MVSTTKVPMLRLSQNITLSNWANRPVSFTLEVFVPAPQPADLDQERWLPAMARLTRMPGLAAPLNGPAPGGETAGGGPR